MVSLEIEDVKEFMGQLFHSDSMFDTFDVHDIKVQTLYLTTISGRVNTKWLDTEEEAGEFVHWSDVRPIVFQLIKGKKTPQSMVLNFTKILEAGNRGALQVRYEENGLRLITGYSMAEFSLDKTKEQDWDQQCMQYLVSKEISYTKIS